MKVLQSNSFQRLAANLDEGPGLVNRHPSPGGLGHSVNRGTEGVDKILERWDEDRPKKKRKKKKIYQLGIEVEKSPREEAEEHRNYS